MYRRLWDRAFAQTIDRLSSEKFGVDGATLMENAGQAVAAKAQTLVGQRPVLVLVGIGNNGGDALVVARLLGAAGHAVHVCLVGHDSGQLTSACRQQRDKLPPALQAQVFSYSPGALLQRPLKAPLIIDGVLGIGAAGPLRPGPGRQCLAEAAALADKIVLAIDVPSGLDADNTGEQELPLGADYSVTFGGLRPAHVIAPARRWCGAVSCHAIGFPDAAVTAAAALIPPYVLQAEPAACLAADPWQQLSRDAHKFDRGHILVIGGSAGKFGAPLLAALAALRGGAGWSTVAIDDEILRGDVGQLPLELTFAGFFADNRLDAAALGDFLDERRVRTVIIGPGCVEQPLDLTALRCLHAAQKNNGVALVFDAGALHGLTDLLAGLGEKFAAEKTILTPHPGEWLKLSARAPLPAPTTAADLDACQQAVRTYGVTLAYKHATPLVISSDAPAVAVTHGSNTLGRAGSGDVLAGLIAAHLAVGVPAAAAFVRSQCVLIDAAENAAKILGPHGVLASDILRGDSHFLSFSHNAFAK